ncbi:MarR family transcriptional regulator [Paenibacillus hemerocallicola]|jgi:DNA-binding MarR family transcriptional regulator|uniref:MarR family transcriptional regulator n=1 Tax=Paenibacillus hemerocallicola TaxID=1172614 RepID=A0A5C4T118_9BACL|nr:MarR family transcriptional regulator [Paenibacillus hemerocallicola]TNJ62626.1 MarR family transcriptional regulator [Paenibacillus hemerocallicola]
MTHFVVGYAKILENDLTAPQYFILQTLAAAEMRNCSELAGAMDVTLPAVTNLTNKLARKGYIERIVSETDRRNVYLRITDKGREVEARMIERYKELTEGLWSDFSEKEIDLLIASFEKMIRNFPIKS